MKIQEIIRRYNKGIEPSAIARDLNIHKSTVYRWIKRSKSIYTLKPSSRNLRKKSTRPNKIHSSLTNKDRIDIVKLREDKGYCAIKIKHELNLSVHYRTVHRFLQSKGLIIEEYNFRRPRFQDTKHMHLSNTKTIGYLQMDVKYITPELSGLDWTCYEYAIIDIYSRYKEAVILNQLDQDGSISALITMIPRLPFEVKFVQTDNGLEFQSRFRDIVNEIGLKHHHTHKKSPNENALIERSFRTDEEEFFFRMKRRPNDYDDLRNMFSSYLKEYNEARPHLGIGLLTPSQLVANVLSH